MSPRIRSLRPKRSAPAASPLDRSAQRSERSERSAPAAYSPKGSHRSAVPASAKRPFVSNGVERMATTESLEPARDAREVFVALLAEALLEVALSACVEAETEPVCSTRQAARPAN